MFKSLYMLGNTEKINNVCLIILASVATIAALAYTRTAMVPFIISLFIFAVLSPVIAGIELKLKVPRLVAIILCVGILVSITAVTWLFLFQSVKSFIMNIDIYKLKAIDLVQDISITAANFGLNVNPNVLQDEIQHLPVLDWARYFTGSIAAFLGSSFLIFIFTLFLIIGEKKTLLPADSLFKSLQENISRYIIIKFLTSLGTGIAVGLLLLLCGVELAFVFAFLTFLLNFIPNIGSFVAALLPLPIVVLNTGFGAIFFIVLIGQILIHSTIGTFLEPKLLGNRMDLHPIAILMFLIFWGLVWGIPGMFLAVPITAILKIVLSKIEATKSFSELLAGRIS